MAAQSYYQDSSSGTGSGPVSPVPLPPGLRWLLVGAVVSVVLLIGLPVKMIIDRDGTMATILRDQPGLDERAQTVAFVAVIGYTVALHAIHVALLVWFMIKTLGGRRWARIALTVYLVAASILGLNSAAKGIDYLQVVIVTDLVHLIMLVLLWVPPSVRSFFAAHRASALARHRPDVAAATEAG